MEGKLLPGVGGIVSAIETVTNKKAKVIGKPQTYILEEILERYKFKSDSTFIIGDRLDSDIEAGNKLGLKTILVLTGATDKEQAFKSKGLQKPDYIIEDLRGLISIINKDS